MLLRVLFRINSTAASDACLVGLRSNTAKASMVNRTAWTRHSCDRRMMRSSRHEKASRHTGFVEGFTAF
jgi:hypothetical protein